MKPLNIKLYLAGKISSSKDQRKLTKVPCPYCCSLIISEWYNRTSAADRRESDWFGHSLLPTNWRPICSTLPSRVHRRLAWWCAWKNKTHFSSYCVCGKYHGNMDVESGRGNLNRSSSSSRPSSFKIEVAMPQGWWRSSLPQFWWNHNNVLS